MVNEMESTKSDESIEKLDTEEKEAKDVATKSS